MTDGARCRSCGGEISEKRRRRHAVFCDWRCSAEASKAAYRGSVPDLGRVVDVSSSTLGAASELIVAADLMTRGGAVFRATSPSCSCDLVLMTEGRLFRVEVKTGYFSTSGRMAHPRADPALHDILAVVVRPSGVVRYLRTCGLALLAARPATIGTSTGSEVDPATETSKGGR